jgi:tetratricopeptide (TPR) repeat protein
MRRPGHGSLRRLVGLALAATFLLLGCNGPDARARGALQSGDSAARQRAVREALNHYRAAAVAEPASFEAQTRRGAMAEVLGEFDEALEAYTRAARLRPSAIAHYRAGALAARMGNATLATDLLGASLGAAPSRTERAARVGLRWVEGISASLNSSRLARMLPDWLFNLLGVTRVALANVGPDREAVAGALFVTLVESGETTRALDLARARGWVRAGADYCAEARNGGAAEARALVGLLVSAEHTDCLLPMGRTLTDSGLVRLSRIVLLDRSRRSADPRVRREAEAFLRHRLPAHDVPKLAESLNIVGYNLQHRFGDQGSAVAVYQKAITADPRFSWPYANLGRLYMDMDQHEVALEWLKQAVRVNPAHFRAQVNLGVTLFSLERYAEAVGAYRAALALRPDDAVVHADLGRTLLKLGQEAEGLREMQTALRIDPSLEAEREFLSRRLGREQAGGQPPFASR